MLDFDITDIKDNIKKALTSTKMDYLNISAILNTITTINDFINIDNNFSNYTRSDAFELLDLINLLRIEPYASKQNEKILQDCIESHKYYVNFNNSNGRIFK